MRGDDGGTGEKGEPGPPGSTGSTGSQGIEGEQGAKGNRGGKVCVVAPRWCGRPLVVVVVFTYLICFPIHVRTQGATGATGTPGTDGNVGAAVSGVVVRLVGGRGVTSGGY